MTSLRAGRMPGEEHNLSFWRRVRSESLRQRSALVTACKALEWKNINGILRGQGDLVYAADETFGLHVLEIQPDGKTLKLVNSLKLTD